MLLISAIFGSCHPDIPQNPVIIDPIDTIETNQYVELLWKKPILDDTIDVGSKMPIVYQSKAGLIHEFGGSNRLLTFRESNLGEILWTWQNPNYFGEDFTNKAPQIFGDYMLLSGWNNMTVINLSTGIEVWTFNTKELGNYCGGVYHTLIGDQIYLSVHECNSKRTQRKLFRSSIINRNWELIYQHDRNDGYEGNFMPSAFYNNSVGDSLLIFQDRMINFSTQDSRVDLIAFNLNSRIIEWKVEDIDPEGSSNVRAPTVYQSKVFFMGQRTIHCVTADSGKFVWERQYPKESDGSYAKHFSGDMNLPVFNNMLISHPDNQLMEALNPNSGIPIWIQSEDSHQVNKVAGDPYEMILYKDYIIYSSQSQGGVCFHKLFNGELRYRLRSPSIKKSSGHDFNKPIAIDQELGLLYACDGWFWYCYKLKI
ncbi:MAG: PQQ-binding-like beta-propeller repeat protein [Saprospiraceae bacterium]